ncbi:hypothetical protein PQR02_02585 [Paraburkholderia sediminicola]|uniref:Uncharacterized protein n=1 Tax=Paraburkholderia rhynchosiae TaxID=487049 RepID=A0ACC7N509_9BURK
MASVDRLAMNSIQGRASDMALKQDPTIFVRIINGKLILWDYSSHSQYEIGHQHIRRILEISNGSEISSSAVDSDIVNSGIFNEDDRDFKKWGWDCLSHIFHLGTQIVLDEGADLPIDDSYEGYVAYCASIVDKVPETRYARDGDPVALPAPDKDFEANPRLADVLMTRKTSRSFTPSP